MGYPDITYRSELPPVTRKELEQLCTLIQAYLSREHNADGGHADITAESITLEPGGGLAFESDANGVEDGLIVHDEDVLRLTAPYITLQATENYVEIVTPTSGAILGHVIDNAGTEHQFDDFLSVIRGLRLSGQSSYTPSANDTDAFPGDAYGPLYSFYRATPAEFIAMVRGTGTPARA